MTADPIDAPLGTDLPTGTRFIGPDPGSIARWAAGDAPSPDDLNSCVACGLCLPHCPTYVLTGDETASPRGRIAAMRAVQEGRAEVDDTFASYMDLCLVCRACEDVCPSHVPFGRMMERARSQVEPHRSRRSRLVRTLGLDVILARPRLLGLATALQPLASPFMGRRVRRLLPAPSRRLHRLPRRADPPPGTARRGTVAMLTGCVQDRWFRGVNEATIRVLTRGGWRVIVPRAQRCCGALHAHNGHLDAARSLAKRNASAFAGVDAIVVNAAGCSAHMKSYKELTDDISMPPVLDLMEFLYDQRLASDRAPVGGKPRRVAYHDACHALRAQGIRKQPRALLGAIPGLEVVDIPNGDRCCGAAGIYNVTQPEMADALMRRTVEAVVSTGCTVVASANPGCTMQLRAGARALGVRLEVVHPVELLDRAYEGS